MTEFVLKSYQRRRSTCSAPSSRRARSEGKGSVEESGYGYRSEPFGEVPCVCFRIPTGGGKTLLASHAIVRVAKEWMDSDAPTALWLTPSETIRAQTMIALQMPGHPYRAALEATYGQSFQICDLESVAAVSPQDFGRQAVVVVATIQSSGSRKSGSAQCLCVLRVVRAALPRSAPAAARGVDQAFPMHRSHRAGRGRSRFAVERPVGQPKFSFATGSRSSGPSSSSTKPTTPRPSASFEALKRLNPAMILELTATPIPKRTNVLYHVSAQELQAEDMIKLPIVLMEHPQGWEAAVLDAVQTQRKLEAEAQKENEYIRPIVLFQAQNATERVNVQALRQP